MSSENTYLHSHIKTKVGLAYDLNKIHNYMSLSVLSSEVMVEVSCDSLISGSIC